MKPIVLILEDNIKSLEQRARLFQNRGMIVVTAKSTREARQKFAYTPSIDLVICDYNLDTEDPDNNEGVLFARELREVGFNSPMVLYSGRDDVDINANIALKNEDDGEMNVTPDRPFQYSAQRSRMSGDAQKEWVIAATKHAETKRNNGLSIASRLAEKYDLSALELQELLNLIPGTGVMVSDTAPEHDKVPFTNFEVESEVRRDGFQIRVVTQKSLEDHGLREIKLKVPLMIWVHETDAGVYAEPLGCPELQTTAKDEQHAIVTLVLSLADAADGKSTDPRIENFAINQFA